jgi:hypothetical protein
VATYGSGYFDGTGDYLSAPSVPASGTGSFCFEAWIYPTNSSTNQMIIGAVNGGMWVGMNIDTANNFSIGRAFTANDNGVSFTWANNRWYHVAVNRNGTNLQFFVDGVQIGSTLTNSINYSVAGRLIAAEGTTPATFYSGYIAGLRVVNASVYTSAFTPPTAPPSVIANTTLLTTQYNGGGNNSGFKDSSQFNFPITRNGNTTQGTFTPYGSNWSNYFNGTNAYWKQASSTNYVFGTGDFTVECWFNPGDSSANMRRLFGIGYGGNGGSHGCTWDLRYQGTESPTGQIAFGRYDGSTDTTFNTSGATITIGQWNHIAVSRTGGNLRIFVNGVAYYNAANSTNYSSVTFGGNTELWVGLGYYGPAGGLGGPRYFGGYMSNIRIINGTGIYSSTFTPSTTPLTAITSTQLLTAQSNRFVDNSTNAQAITPSGSPSVQRFSPFAPLTVYNPTTYGGSGYFDGSGDYLVASSTSGQLGSGDFTIECWSYLISKVSLYPVIWGNYTSFGAGSLAIFAGHDAANTSKYNIAINGTFPAIQSTASIIYNQWTHIALVRSGSTITLYVNGVANGTATSSATLNGTSGTTYIGTAGDAISNGYLNGYLTDSRVLVGTALYTTAFTPPTAPLTAITNTRLLLNYTNPAILDNSMLNNLETVGNAAVSTSVKKYGAASMYFEGTSPYGYLKGNANLSQNVAFGTGDFTVECWVYLTTTASDSTIMDTRPGSNSANYFLFYLWTNGGAQLPTIAWYSPTSYVLSTGTVSSGTWTHIAICRASGTIRSFKDGVLQQSASDTRSYANPGAPYPYIGAAYGVGVDSFKGYIDDFRITKYARYTATFTPPEQAFPNG